ncbi:MAG: type sorting protein, partial [Bacteroidota bacterium]|nr:type sorting protein [Bacteroidota bacterium]
MLKKQILNIIFLLLSLGSVKSQEVVTGLQSNPVLKSGKSESTLMKGFTDTLELPFFDDFSGRGVFPDAGRWSDNNIFINDTYSNSQISIGVATFDALDNSGRMYETASPAGFEADRLTSQPINLNYLPSDNIRLSFYFQPGGLADMPEVKDSLVVQFFAPEIESWYSVWKGSISNNPDFKAVILYINQPEFLKKGFMFRFINYASLSDNLGDPSMVGNCDQWNIDYILLDKNREPGDTVFTDVAFRLPLRSLLKTHEAMPWKQFRQIYLQEMDTEIPVHYRNNDTIIRNVTRNFEIRDVYEESQAALFSAGATNIAPLKNEDYNASLIHTFNTVNNDSALFRITGWLITDDFDPKDNDTLVYYQIFNNYFAFDDGSAENGYGINGLGSKNAMVAVRFKSFMKDTLRAIKICFNDSYLNANKRSFNLMVWDDNGGIPGNVLYSGNEVMVEQGEAINGFYTYHLSAGVAVDDIFYVGWKQLSDAFLNAGLDINTPHYGRQFYWINGTWNPSQVNGSLMI